MFADEITIDVSVRGWEGSKGRESGRLHGNHFLEGDLAVRSGVVGLGSLSNFAHCEMILPSKSPNSNIICAPSLRAV